MGAGKSLNGREKNLGAEKSRTTRGALLVVLDFSAPEFFSRPFRLFPAAPKNCPWVSEDATDRNCFCKKNFTIHTKFHIGKTILENLPGEINAAIIK